IEKKILFSLSNGDPSFFFRKEERRKGTPRVFLPSVSSMRQTSVKSIYRLSFSFLHLLFYQLSVFLSIFLSFSSFFLAFSLFSSPLFDTQRKLFTL
ncbi:hypothetical protein CSUI_008841, partial [Cystoisospora suis]